MRAKDRGSSSLKILPSGSAPIATLSRFCHSERTCQINKSAKPCAKLQLKQESRGVLTERACFTTTHLRTAHYIDPGRSIPDTLTGHRSTSPVWIIPTAKQC